jgi:hypothetical protein
MQATSIVFNIIKAASDYEDKPIINLLTDSSYSMFDNQIKQLDKLSLFPLENSNDYISYDAILSHNPIGFSSYVQQLYQLHLNSAIYFHHLCPNNFKKEDKFLLKNTLKQSYKIFANEYIMNSWGFETDPQSFVIPYGILSDNELITKTKSVVVLNLNNNPSINTLFQYINNVFNDAVLVNDIQDYKTYKSIQEAAICVEAESHFNIITAIANGCYVISGLDYLSENGLFSISSYDHILYNIKELLESYNYETAEKNKELIAKKYSYVKFQNLFLDLLDNIRQEPYIYAKAN